MKNNDFRIGHRDDALALLDEMITHCEKVNKDCFLAYRGMNNAIGNTGYYWPRLAALRDAIERGIV